VTDVAFYHLQKAKLEDALPILLERTLESGNRALVIAGSEERVEALAERLWTYRSDSWLPHGTARDGDPEYQPIWLTARDENPNGASFVFLTEGAVAAHIEHFSRGFDLFDGNDDGAVAAARERWRALKSAGHTLTYWQQGERGGWERHA
jgi:DNA polymerase III subunit chi